MKHEEQLIDALLKEQAKGPAADEKLLAAIEEKLDRAGRPGRRSFLRRGLPLGIAAAVALGTAGVYHWQRDTSPEVARHDVVEARRSAGEVVNELGVEVSELPRLREEKQAAAREETLPGVPASKPMDYFADEAFDDQATLGRSLATRRASAAPPIDRLQLMPAETDAMPAALPQRQAFDTERYGQLVDPKWQSPWTAPLSTFSIDVDTASYTNVRRMIEEGREVPPDAVRIEELVNYFDYNYAGPEGDRSFAVGATLATCPWAPRHLLARVAIKGREIENEVRPASNLVFLIDVSGSMQSSDKLGLLKNSMSLLIDELDERDRVGIVVYAGTEGVVLPPTKLDEEGKAAAQQAISQLEAGGTTNGGADLIRAYAMAAEGRIDGGVNRVILASDGDFNVGVTGQGELVSLAKKGAAEGVSMSVLGFGAGNLNDSMMEAVSNDANGNYFYIDREQEAERVFLQKLTGTLVTIAKDVKIQVEFNPGKVKAYRLIGYANRVLADRDFNDDKVDAGDIGAGHTVTALYEIVPDGVEMPEVGEIDQLRYQRPEGRGELVESEDWFTLKLRHKEPEGEVSKLIETEVEGEPVAWEDAGNDFRTATAAAMFGMKLRGMAATENESWERIREILQPALAEDPHEQRAEFLELLRKLD